MNSDNDGVVKRALFGPLFVSRSLVEVSERPAITNVPGQQVEPETAEESSLLFTLPEYLIIRIFTTEKGGAFRGRCVCTKLREIITNNGLLKDYWMKGGSWNCSAMARYLASLSEGSLFPIPRISLDETTKTQLIFDILEMPWASIDFREVPIRKFISEEVWRVMCNCTSLRELYLPSGTKTLEGLHRCRKLERLSLDANEGDDCTALSSLTNLRFLRLSNCIHLKDPSPLSTLAQLNYLSLSYSPVDNILFIQNLLLLSDLDLSHTGRLEDISPLAHLPHLRQLNLCSSAITSIDPLAALTSLVNLDISATSVNRFEALYDLKLETLNLQYTWINNGTLSHMATGRISLSLRWLNIKDTATDLESVNGLLALQFVCHNSVEEWGQTKTIR
ncbi:internalin, peptidoglycan bound protein (LPXTG motif) [Planoprotostelium fungivorum]|uniref:Internalin, peptidoglycan bound protein (LPXTG motif) n=1 Tax=Planoprotostelium fungivorum TaxID=1890364 RepID=A0A2P6MQX0_9EUKA|nr:internalin, peptidoglycan bound protein (LPXTG motif) [Planoprotostelium fungivorum]